jgi:rhodanese-related sulfurtransferase
MYDYPLFVFLLMFDCTVLYGISLTHTHNIGYNSILFRVSAPIVIHCASGKRATKAKEILQNQGYANVVSAGGFGSLGYLQETLNEM